mmetsp:Transcript_81671/g.218540  ORF Transcript_81671/g.218540 Transcript_81671/m.218540 type:complete len:129 (+) Transcript_81671:577-963(+)
MPWKLLGFPPWSAESCAAAAARQLCGVLARSENTPRPVLWATSMGFAWIDRSRAWSVRRRARGLRVQLVARSLGASSREVAAAGRRASTGKCVLAMSCSSPVVVLAGGGQVEGRVICAVMRFLLLSAV